MAATILMALTGCIGEGTVGPTSPPAGASSINPDGAPEPVVCDQMLDDEVLEALGWTIAGPPASTSVSCERIAPPSTVTAAIRQDLFGGGDPALAKQRLADQCASLAGKVAYVVDLDTEWLAGDAPACLREFDAGRDTRPGAAVSRYRKSRRSWRSRCSQGSRPSLSSCTPASI